MLLVIICTLGTGQQALLEDARVPRLVECRNTELLVRILFDDAKRVLVCVERGHEDERDVDAVGSVEVLDLTNGQVEESHVILDLEGTLCAGHTCDRDHISTNTYQRRVDSPMEVPRPPLTLRTASLLRLE